MLDNDVLIAVKRKELVLKGIRNRKDGLWDIPLDPYPKWNLQHNNHNTRNDHAALYTTTTKVPTLSKMKNVRPEYLRCNRQTTKDEHSQPKSTTERSKDIFEEWRQDFDAMSEIIEDSRDDGLIR